MQFLSAASAWFALALPLIAMMYMLKRSYPETEVASHLLWRRLLREQEANKPWQRLRGRLLLLLQLLAALLIVAALMEPAIWRADSTRGHAVLVIDRSGSMAELMDAGGGTHPQTRFQDAIEAAKGWIGEQPANREITLIASGAEPEELDGDHSDRAALLARLDELSPYYGRTDNAAALSLGDSLLQGEQGGIMVLFTDGRWLDAKEANELRLSTPVDVFVSGGEERQPSGAIIQMGVRSDPANGEYQQASVTVQNNGETEMAFQLRLSAARLDQGMELVRELEVSVPPGEWRSVSADGLPLAPYYRAQLMPSVDSVPVDNIAYAFPAGSQASKLLLVTEGNLFLEKALQLAGVQPVKMAPNAPAPSEEASETFDAIVVDGAYELLMGDGDWRELLEDKPLWLIDHPQTGAENTAVPKHSAAEAAEHPVVSYISLLDTYIGRMNVPTPDEVVWGAPILTYGGVPAIYAGTDKGMPKLRYTFKLQDSDLPLRPEFPVLIVQSVEWLRGGTTGQLGAVQAGQPLELAFRSATERAEWTLVERLPQGDGAPGERPVPLPDLVMGEGVQEAPTVPGLYALKELDEKGEVVEERYLSVVPDYAEWMPETEDEHNLSLQYGSKADEEGGASVDQAEAERQDDRSAFSQQPLLLWLALATLAVMALEWEVYRRGYSG
ncbi:VWA domain-containing protein [Paenibacillus sp. PL2-23]|uniref:vWA domain-containing protein n=1 Tax=Paenibacillus sp. PL2-23 TaxID=2100729 RepID=UPI0030F90406